MDKTSELHHLYTDVSEDEAIQVAHYLDAQGQPGHSLFFNTTTHNWDPESQELGIMVTCTSERVAIDALDNAIRTAHQIHTVHNAA